MDSDVMLRVALVAERLSEKKIFGRWDDYRDLAEAWGGGMVDNFPHFYELLFASYGGESYEGQAVVIFKRDDQLFEAYDSHCSCDGLEDWSPERTTVQALAMRDRASFLSDHDGRARDAYWQLVDSMQNRC